MSRLMGGAGSLGRVSSPRSQRGASYSASAARPQGRELPPELRGDAEALFGEDFSDVRLFTSRVAQRMGATAFTTGSQIHVAPGALDGDPAKVVLLLGHELAHVVQQRRGKVRNTRGYGVQWVRDEALEAEADEMGRALQAMQRDKKLVDTKTRKYKKKAKERRESAKVEETLERQAEDWLKKYGHSTDRHVGMTTLQLDARNIPLATTFETVDDLVAAAKTLIQMNESLLNHWYKKGLKDRLVLWCYRPEDCEVRGRRKLERPSWHYEQSVMPPHPGFEDVDADELEYVIGIFDRNAWTGEAKGFVTCYPSDCEPGA